jgi:hypothetical protein
LERQTKEEKAAMSGDRAKGKKKAAKWALWSAFAASASAAASFYCERTLEEIAGARETTAASVETFESVAPSADVGAESPSELLLREAIARLEGLRSFSADLEFEARLFGERYFGRGRYEETNEIPSGSAARRSALESARYRLRASVARGSAKEARDGGEENVLL